MSSDSDFDEVSRRKWEERRSRQRQPRSRPPRNTPPTERLDPTQAVPPPTPDKGGDTGRYNREWRRERTVRTSSRSAPLSSPQVFAVWLQRGGWMIVAGVVTVLIIGLIWALISEHNERRVNSPFTPQVTAMPAQGGLPAGLPTVTPESGVAPAAPAGALAPAFVVVNTGGLGLRMRASPSTDGAVVETLPDGARVEQIGEDSMGSSYVWRKVRAPSGSEGWVAVDFLQPAP